MNKPKRDYYIRKITRLRAVACSSCDWTTCADKAVSYLQLVLQLGLTGSERDTLLLKMAKGEFLQCSVTAHYKTWQRDGVTHS